MLHKHHIIPKHMGGSDDPSNLVEFCSEHKLNRGTMSLLVNGKKKKIDNHKGYKIKFKENFDELQRSRI
jgi:hypothetical protein